jgi:hypothetical protein
MVMFPLAATKLRRRSPSFKIWSSCTGFASRLKKVDSGLKVRSAGLMPLGVGGLAPDKDGGRFSSVSSGSIFSSLKWPRKDLSG